MTGSDASLLFKSFVATSVSNLDSYRRDRPNLDVRREGWTEVWGIDGSSSAAVDRDQAHGEAVCGWKARSEDWDLEQVVAERTKESSTPYPSIPLTLSQHRVAWHEQLVLRVANVPHIVLNSSYLASESTGQLPYLRDVGSISANKSNTDDGGSSRPPALVGRRNPGSLLDPNPEVRPSGSHIVDYLGSSSQLSSAHNIMNLDEGLDDAQKADGLAYSTLITQTLNTVIVALRYGDYRAWEEVYRHQSITACLDPNGTDAANGSNTRGRGFFNWAAWFQTWSERTVALKELKLSNTRERDELFDGDDVNVDRAVALARRCYGSLNCRLLESSGVSLLGVEQLTTVDAMLFAHLADALCDLHLVTILSEYQGLVSFFQSTYEKYFGKNYGADIEWVQWNNRTNATNAFNHIPIGGKRAGISTEDYRDAIKLMQSMALHCHDLGEALADAALVRGKEDGHVLSEQKKNAGEMFHRWRMHGTLSEEKGVSTNKKEQKRSDSEEDEEEDEMTRKSRQHMEKLKKDAKNNDELWVSGVILASIVAYALAAASAKKA